LPRKRLPQNIKCILFDLDGVLIDTRQALIEAYKITHRTLLGTDIPESYLDEVMNTSPNSLLSGMFPDNKKEALRIFEFNKKKVLIETICVPGITKIINLLGQEKILGVVTSRNQRDALYYLEKTGLLRFMSSVVTWGKTRKHKPEPEPLLSALEQCSCTPRETIYVGDMPEDMIAAKAANMFSAGAVWVKGCSIEDMQNANPDVILYTPIELLKYFHKNGGEVVNYD